MKQLCIVVTGGAASVGLEIARKFLALDHRVHICDIADQALSEALAGNPGLRGTRADVGNFADVERLFSEVFAYTDTVDVLVNNVGIPGPHAPLEQVKPQEWMDTLGVNLNGVFYTIRRVLPGMKARRQGVIVNISSSSTRTGLPSRIPYVVSKAGVEALTRTLAREVGPFGIRCNAILPGMINNDRMLSIVRRRASAEGRTEDDIKQEYLRYISMRAPVEPAEIADVVLFLASSQAIHITGQLIGVDGNLEWEG